MEVFTWTPDRSVPKNSKPNVKVIKFGESYESRISFGINNIAKSWNVAFNNRDVADIDAIEAFFEARAGLEAFEWTPPNAATAIAVVCREWSRSDLNASYASIQTSFELVNEV